MAAMVVSFRADDQTVAELRELAGGRAFSDAIREAIHARYRAVLYERAAWDAERLRNDPEDVAEMQAVQEDMRNISAW